MRARLAGMLPATAVALAEGAWVAVVYAALDIVPAGGHAALGLWSFVIAAAIGIALARIAGDEDARLGLPELVLLTVCAYLAGVALDALAAGRPISQPLDVVRVGGLMTAVAAWRGATHWRPEDDDLSLATVLAIGVPALSLPFIVALAGTDAQRQEFLSLAVPATLLFVAAGLAAVGLTRLAALGRLTGTDRRRGQSWLALLAGLIAGLLLVALPVAWLVGAPVAALFGWVTDPVAAGVRTFAGVLTNLAAGAGYQPPPPPQPVPGLTPDQAKMPTTGPVALIVLIPLSAALLVLAFVLIQLLRTRAARRVRPIRTGIEESGLELPRFSLPEIRLPSLHLPRRARRPRTASEAYVAALEHLNGSTEARLGAESPRRHARRVAGRLGWRFALLAADYELERYAGIELSKAETARALRRLAALRGRL
jgi:hypothetical protein